MTNADYDGFGREFDRLAAALERFKVNPSEAAARLDAYFQVLKKFPLSVVIAKADAWLERESKMPKPAEWAAIVPLKPAVDLDVLSADEARDWLEAEQSRWQGPCCKCSECKSTGVSDLALRFVPEFDGNDRDRHVRIGDRIVTAGHWAHGMELARYYLARESFWSRFDAMFPKNPRRGNHDASFEDEGTPRHQRKVGELTKAVGR